MNFPNMRALLTLILVTAVVFVLVPVNANASGISVDAGLTPSEDRWILRTQFGYMERREDPTSLDREMTMYAFRTVLAYGFRRNLTFMVRQSVMRREMLVAGSSSEETGLADLYLLSKYGIYRRNTPAYTFGIATTLGLESPSGADAFTSDTWDIKPGFYMSWRSGPWASDFNIDYAWNGFADKSAGGMNPGDELSLDWAFAHQFSIREKADASFTPVLELSYRDVSPDRLSGHSVSSTGESALYLSPGMKFTKSSLILELLVQIPVQQDQRGTQLERGTNVLGGMRYMF
jgi:hypothetical protein